MKRDLGVLILLTLAAQTDEPELVSANIPFYPPLARQARVSGTVKVGSLFQQTLRNQPTLK